MTTPMNLDMPALSSNRYRLSLSPVTEQKAALLEEMLWTLPEVESVTFRLDNNEKIQGLVVILSRASGESRVRELLKVSPSMAAMTVEHLGIIQEEDWAESWKKYWHVNRILPHLVICPSWEAFDADPADTVLHLDPGSAFGTGTHETTQLMLLVLSDTVQKQNDSIPFVPQSRTLLDVGTGSGILAIAAAKLGFSPISAIDNDPLAVTVAKENMTRNQVADRIKTSIQPLADQPSQSAEIILANILAHVLIEMMPELQRILTPSGSLVMSGIIRRQYPEMRVAIEANGLKLCRILQKGDWLALVCQNR